MVSMIELLKTTQRLNRTQSKGDTTQDEEPDQRLNSMADHPSVSDLKKSHNFSHLESLQTTNNNKLAKTNYLNIPK